MKAGLVLTTIHDCRELLNAYYANFLDYCYLPDVTVYVVADEKTPFGLYDVCNELAKKGLTALFLTIEEQESFLEELGIKPSFIQRNSDHRRNVGYLMAYLDGQDFIVSIDDDNYPLPGVNFIGHHAIVCGRHVNWAVSTDSWFNPLEDLKTEPSILYPRGFPYFARGELNKLEHIDGIELCRINEGLWVGDPDVDAISWLSETKPQSKGWLNGCETETVLGKKSWAPINSQNTAIHRDLIPAYYFVRSGHFGDIAQGYFVQAVAKAMGWSVRFGSPLVDHRRNSHNHLKDLQTDINDIVMLERLLPELTQWKLKGSTVSDLYQDLASRIDEFGLRGMAEDMVIWNQVCKQIGVSA